MPRRYETIELIRQQSSMSQKVVSQKDPDYALYSGAYYEEAHKMALIDVLLKNGFFAKEIIPFVKFYRLYLDQRRKAFFASTSSEITKLGFILGLKDNVIQVTK